MVEMYDIWACNYNAGYSENNYTYDTPIINPFIGLHSSKERAIAAVLKYCEEKEIRDPEDIQFYIDNIKRVEID